MEFPLLETVLNAIRDGISSLKDNVLLWLSDIYTSVVTLKDNLIDGFVQTIRSIDDIFVELSLFFSSFWSNLENLFVISDDYFELKFNGIKSQFQSKFGIDLSTLNQLKIQEEMSRFEYNVTLLGIDCVLDYSILEEIRPYSKAIFGLIATLANFMFILHNILVLVRGSSLAHAQQYLGSKDD